MRAISPTEAPVAWRGAAAALASPDMAVASPTPPQAKRKRAMRRLRAVNALARKENAFVPLPAAVKPPPPAAHRSPSPPPGTPPGLTAPQLQQWAHIAQASPLFRALAKILLCIDIPAPPPRAPLAEQLPPPAVQA